ncbi:hypothetical protein PV325_013725, partial [Microctonus aethiopoides]
VSSFPFENLNGKLRALVTDTRFAQLQICSRLSILMNIPELKKKILRDRNSAAVAFCDTIINSHKKYIVHPIGNKMFIVEIFKNIPLPMIVRKSLQAAESYPNLRKLVNAVRSLPNSNADSERIFSYLPDSKMKKRNKLSAVSVNATCVLKSAMKMRNETALDMVIDENHLSCMTSDILYTVEAHQKCELRLQAGEIDKTA